MDIWFIGPCGEKVKPRQDIPPYVDNQGNIWYVAGRYRESHLCLRYPGDEQAQRFIGKETEMAPGGIDEIKRRYDTLAEREFLMQAVDMSQKRTEHPRNREIRLLTAPVRIKSDPANRLFALFKTPGYTVDIDPGKIIYLGEVRLPFKYCTEMVMKLTR